MLDPRNNISEVRTWCRTVEFKFSKKNDTVVIVFMITFRKIVPGTIKWSRKTPTAILHNLREKSGAKIKYWQSYSNFTTYKKTLLAFSPCSPTSILEITSWIISNDACDTAGCSMCTLEYILQDTSSSNLVLGFSKTPFFVMGCVYIDTCSRILFRESNTYNFKNLPAGKHVSMWTQPMKKRSFRISIQQNAYELLRDYGRTIIILHTII